MLKYRHLYLAVNWKLQQISLALGRPSAFAHLVHVNSDLPFKLSNKMFTPEVVARMIPGEAGLQLELLEVGPEPSILFVHGACCQAITWRPLMVALAEVGTSSAALSLRGHGGSTGSSDLQRYRHEHYVQDVLDALNYLARPVTLVGHSMGGRICHLAARRTPIRRLVLLAPCPVQGMLRDGFRMFLRHPYTFVASKLLGSPVRLYRNARVCRSLLYHEATPNVAIDQSGQTLVEESAQAVDQMLARISDAAELSCPVSVIGARQDFMVSADSIEATARAYGVRPVFVEGSGHMLQSEVPAAKLAAILRSW
jgi:pimeloyl-ACP methyl ester carboxylesterase